MRNYEFLSVPFVLSKSPGSLRVCKTPLVAKGQKSLVTMLKMALFARHYIDIGTNDKIMTLHVLTKVLKLVANGQKSLVTMLKMALFALKCIDMVCK